MSCVKSLKKMFLLSNFSTFMFKNQANLLRMKRSLFLKRPIVTFVSDSNSNSLLTELRTPKQFSDRVEYCEEFSFNEGSCLPFLAVNNRDQTQYGIHFGFEELCLRAHGFKWSNGIFYDFIQDVAANKISLDNLDLHGFRYSPADIDRVFLELLLLAKNTGFNVFLSSYGSNILIQDVINNLRVTNFISGIYTPSSIGVRDFTPLPNKVKLLQEMCNNYQLKKKNLLVVDPDKETCEISKLVGYDTIHTKCGFTPQVFQTIVTWMILAKTQKK